VCLIPDTVRHVRHFQTCQTLPDSQTNCHVADVFPGEERRSKASAKGISDLTLAECSKLVAALTDTGDDRLHLEHVPNKKGITLLL